MTGSVNTSVLPDPVKAMPIMSRPDRLLGEDSFRIGPSEDKGALLLCCRPQEPHVHTPYSHGRDALDLNWCWVEDAFFFQASKDGCKKMMHVLLKS